MKESDVRAEVYHMLYTRHGFWPVTQTDAAICWKCHTKITPPKGRPDILVLNPTGPSVVVEVKVVRGGSFAFEQIEPHQRDWLDKWAEDGGCGYLAVGTLVKPRRLWLVDWGSWLRIESLVATVQASIPVVAGKHYSEALQRNAWDMDHLCQPWELARRTGGWDVPAGHSLRRIDDLDASSLWSPSGQPEATGVQAGHPGPLRARPQAPARDD